MLLCRQKHRKQHIHDDAQKPKKYVELQVVERKVEALILPKKVRFETCDITNEQVETSNNHNYVEDRDASHIADHQQPAKSIKSSKVQSWICTETSFDDVFFYLIVVYTLSFTPPLIILI